MSRRMVVEWSQDADALGALYLRERDGQHRMRLHALWLLRRGKQLWDVADLLGVSARAVQNWVEWYRDGGLAEVRRHRLGGAAPGAGAQPKLCSAQQEALRGYARGGMCRRVADAQAWVRDQFGVTYSYWGMWRLLRRLKLRPKVPRPQARKAEPAAQAAWREGVGTSVTRAGGLPAAGRGGMYLCG